jgi:hypothetical protein
MRWSISWNENWQGKPKYSEKTCPNATLSTTYPTWHDLGSNPGRCSGKLATNRLSYGTAFPTSNKDSFCLTGLDWIGNCPPWRRRQIQPPVHCGRYLNYRPWTMYRGRFYETVMSGCCHKPSELHFRGASVMLVLESFCSCLTGITGCLVVLRGISWAFMNEYCNILQ